MCDLLSLSCLHKFRRILILSFVYMACVTYLFVSKFAWICSFLHLLFFQFHIKHVVAWRGVFCEGYSWDLGTSYVWVSWDLLWFWNHLVLVYIVLNSYIYNVHFAVSLQVLERAVVSAHLCAKKRKEEEKFIWGSRREWISCRSLCFLVG